MKQNHLLISLIILSALALAACSSLQADPTPLPDEVDWPTAVEILNSGEVEQVVQLHNLTVTFLLKDGQEVKTVEPFIDEVFKEVERCGAACSNIILATE
jgi:hypothetical protein